MYFGQWNRFLIQTVGSLPSTPTQHSISARERDGGRDGDSPVHAPPQPDDTHSIQHMRHAVKYRVFQNPGTSSTKAKSTQKVRRNSESVLRRQRSCLKSPKDVSTAPDDDSFGDRSAATSLCSFVYPEMDKHILDDDYDDELDATNNLNASNYFKTESESIQQKIYRAACRDVGETPSTYFLNHLAADRMVMKYHVLGPRGGKACAIALAVSLPPPLILSTNLKI